MLQGRISLAQSSVQYFLLAFGLSFDVWTPIFSELMTCGGVVYSFIIDLGDRWYLCSHNYCISGYLISIYCVRIGIKLGQIELTMVTGLHLKASNGGLHVAWPLCQQLNTSFFYM
jgi:hypothetical protein